MPDHPDRFLEGLNELSRLMVDEETLDATLQRVATLVCLSLEGCDMASVTLEGQQARTAASTDEVALWIDEAQYEAENGPCLHALRTRTPVEVPSMADEPRWPRFTARALELDVHSSLAVPLVLRGEGRGSLNVYAHPERAFSEQDLERAGLFAEQAAVAIANSEVYWRTHELTQNLQAALENRDLIGQAKGILMARRGITAEAAFEQLRQASQRQNRKLREVADEVARIGDLDESR